MSAILELAELRQAYASTPTQEAYTLRLLRYDLRDVLAACEAIADAERKDGETAFPEWGRLKREVGRQKRRRESICTIAELHPSVRERYIEAQRSNLLASGDVPISGVLAKLRATAKEVV